jgi:hypothetical protein
MLGKSHVREPQKIPLAQNTVGRRISGTSEDLRGQLTGQLKISRFALYVDNANNVAEDAHLINFIRYVTENNIKENFCFPCLRRWN